MREKNDEEPKASCGTATPEEAQNYEELALRQLRATGFRITMPRVQVIRALADTRKAMTAYQIHEKIMQAGGKIDVVSVYRILGTLVEIGLAHHIGVADGYFPCRMDDAHQQDSAHFVCDRCGCITEVNVPQETKDATHRQAHQIGFLPTGIRIEVVGLCPDCQGGGASAE
ncbi:MAG TPA: Fur family transcriptional regulator [Fimbriimonadaceae bacterium]|nr:Fur family transcriptional regulator [Fimbriimonadaceae bacterium]